MHQSSQNRLNLHDTLFSLGFPTQDTKKHRSPYAGNTNQDGNSRPSLVDRDLRHQSDCIVVGVYLRRGVEF